MSVTIQGWESVAAAILSQDFLAVFDALVSVGCRPVPLKRDSSGKIKMPCQSAWGKQPLDLRRAEMVFQVEQHARRAANIPNWVTSHGIGVQPDNYIVIDLDPPGKDRSLLPQVVEEAANLLCGGECELPDTFGYDTAAGRHLWYKTTPAIVAAWAKGGKLQFTLPGGGVAEIFTGHHGESGQMQVAFPPSTGKTYHAGTTVEPAELPETIEAAILAHFTGSVAENYVPYVPRPRAGSDGAVIGAEEERYFNTAVFDSPDCLTREMAAAPAGHRWITFRRVMIRCASLAAACGQQYRKQEIMHAIFEAYRSTGSDGAEHAIRSSTPEWAWGVGAAKPAYIDWHEPHVTNPNFGRPSAGKRAASPDEFVDGDEFDGNPYIRNAYVGLVALRNLLLNNQSTWWWVRPALAEKWGAAIADQLTAKLAAELGITWPEPDAKSKRGHRRDLKWFQDKARAEGWQPEEERETGSRNNWEDTLAKVMALYPNVRDPGKAKSSESSQAHGILFLGEQSRRIVVWKGDVYRHDGSRYVIWDDKEFDVYITQWLISHYKRIAERQTDSEPFSLKESDVKTLRHVIETYATLTVENAPTCPAWINGDNTMNADDCIIFTNVVLNVRTGETTPVTDELFTTFNVGYDYQPGDQVPVEWFRFLRSVWGETPEAITELQKWFAYCLTCDTQFHKMLVLVGQPRSGKGIIQGVLQSVLGEDNVIGMSISRLAGDFGTNTMIGRRLIMFPDVVMPTTQKELGQITESLLSISGGDSVTIPRKWKEDWNGKLNVKLMMTSNSLPRTTGTSGGLATRLHVLTMPHSFVGREDRGLAKRLHAERHLIMNWAILGLELLYKDGFTATASGAEAAQEMTELAEPVMGFLRAAVDTVGGDECFVTLHDMYEGWKRWCVATGHQSGSQHHFFAKMNRLPIGNTRKVKRMGSSTAKVYVGVRWHDGHGPERIGGF